MEVNGFDEARSALEALANAISSDTLMRWAGQIEGEVKQNCRESAIFKGVIRSDGKFGIDINGRGTDVDCILSAIRDHLPQMHPATRAFYEKVIDAYEARKREISRHSSEDAQK